MTDRVRFEVGDQVEIYDYTPPGYHPEIKSHNGKIGIIKSISTSIVSRENFPDIATIEIPEDCGFINIRSPVAYLKKINNYAIKNIESPSPLKLEVGKKYNIKIAEHNPYVFLSNTLDHGFEGLNYPYVFINDLGEIETFSDNFLKKGITEHREPIKNEVVGWICFNLVLLLEDHKIFNSRELAIRSSVNPLQEIKKMKIAFEQLPEPDNE